MKLLSMIILSLTTLSTLAFSKDIVCRNAYQVEKDMALEAEITATITKVKDGTYLLTDRTLFFNLDGYGEESWYKFISSEEKEGITNLKGYNPRKYKGHMKFDYDQSLRGKDIDSPNSRFYGLLELLIPIDKIDSAKSGETFYAPIIMTWVSDHWGGSRTLECYVK